MASTYTTNLGIEKIGTGEQSGTWGDTTNTNFDILDEAVNGIISITLSSAGSSGSPTALPITDGASSNGRNKFIEFVDGGDLGGTAYVQLTPNDAEKIVHIRNSLSSSRSVIVFQGTYNASNDFEIVNGADVLLKFNGGGSGATVTDVNVDLTVTGLTATTANATTVDTTNLEVTNIKAKDGTSAGSIADSTGVVTLASSVLTTTDINGGTIDGAVIGGASAAAITATTITGTTITASTAVVPDASDGATLGSTSLEWSDLYLADGAVVYFGDDQDITLTHVADTGLTLKHANTGDDKFPTFLLATGDTDIAANDKLGVINFQAPDEGAGTDAILVAAGIEAVSEGDFSASSNATSLVFKTGASEAAAEKMRVDSSGNVSIGSSSNHAGARVVINRSPPTAFGSPMFQVGQETFTGSGMYSIGFGYTTSGSDNPPVEIAALTTTDGGSTKADIVFGTRSSTGNVAVTERMRIDSSGNVSVGDTTPSSGAGWNRFLKVAGGTSNAVILDGTDSQEAGIGASDGLFIDSLGHTTASNNTIIFRNTSTNSSYTAVERMRITSAGDVLVAKTSASFTTLGPELRANGQINAASAADFLNMYSTSASAYRFYVTNAGTINATSTSISAISDQSLKENIRDLDKGLETINALQPRRFDWKNGDGNDIMGFVAQEVQSSLPELVHSTKYNESENKLAIKMGDMIPSMVKAIQELSAQVTELKAEVAALKGA